jgi:hypothetical protein
MPVDMAVLAYHNALRFQGWIGSLALWTEHELFGQAAPSVKLRRQHGPIEGLAVEERLKKLGEVLLPLLDRSNRMMVRNLKALKPRWTPENRPVVDGSKPASGVSAPSTRVLPHRSHGAQEGRGPRR